MPSADSKLLKSPKIEEDGSEDKRSLGTILQNRKKKSSNVPSNSRPNLKKEKQEVDEDDKKPIGSGSRSKGSKVKKEEVFDFDDDEPISKRSSATKSNQGLKKSVKEEVKNKKNAKLVQENKKKETKEKKVYEMPGQKRDPPEERDPLRIFYETLYKQLPHSEMAQFWMMESGLLSKEEAKKVYEKRLKKTQMQKLGSPMKSLKSSVNGAKYVSTKKNTPSPVTSNLKKETDSKVVQTQSKKRKNKDGSSVEESDDDNDFIVSSLKKKQRAA